MSKRKIKSDEELDEAILQIGQCQQKRAKINSALDERVQKLRRVAEQRAEIFNNEIVELTERIKIYANANRETLTKGGKAKTVKFGSGEINWKSGRVSVRIDDENQLIAKLDKNGIAGDFVVEKRTISKPAIIKGFDKVKCYKGVELVTGPESFSIKPHETKLAEVST